MKEVISFLLCFAAFVGCSNASSPAGDGGKRSVGHIIEDDYRKFIDECTILNPDRTHTVDVNDVFIVELPEIPSSGYLWHFKILNSENVELVQDRGFDFNKPGVIGGTHKHLWKFKALKQGETEIVFKSYRQWMGEESADEQHRFALKINN